MRAMNIRTMLDMISNEELVLPAMQRPFVWDEERILRLMDSLMRAFPIGMVLIWETDEAQRFRPFAQDAHAGEHPLVNFPEANGKRLKYVLDGQQRLTSLNIAACGSLDGKRLYVDVLSGDARDSKTGENLDPGEMYYDFRFLTGPEVASLNAVADDGKRGQYFVAYRDFMKLDPVHAMMKAAELAKNLKLGEVQAQRVGENFNRAVNVLVSTLPLQVHVIDEFGQSTTPIEEILELFVRINSGGLILQKSDLLMSLLDLKWNDVQPALLSVAYEASKNSPFEVTRDLVLKTALLLVGEDTRFDKLVKDRDNIEKMAPKLKAALPQVDAAWMKLVVLLKMNCKIHSPRFFRQATNALLPFAVYLCEHPKPTQAEENRLVTGIYLALMSGVFGAAEARMGAFGRKYCRDAKQFPLESLAQLIARTALVKSLDDLLHAQLDLSLNIAHGGVVIDGNPDQLERDHIFPKALLLDQQVPLARANHYANFHFLRQKDNRNKTDKPPAEWFDKPGPNAEPYSDQDLADRLLSRDLIQPGAFGTLIDVRGARIRDAACKMFHMTEADVNKLFV
jgi:uncharacterized protein DUF262